MLFAAIGVAWAGLQPGPAHAQCAPNSTTRMVSTCAPGWSDQARHLSSADFNPWPAVPVSASSMGATIASSVPAGAPTHPMCTSDVSISRVDGADHLALISCASSATASAVWVNLDDLQCEDNNAAVQSGQRAFSGSPAPRCPPDQNPPPAGRSDGLVRSSFSNQLISETSAAQLSRLRDIANASYQRIDNDMSNIMDGVSPLIDDSGSSDPDTRSQAGNELKRKIALSASQLETLSVRATRMFGDGCDGPPGANDSATIRGQRTCNLLKNAFAKARSLSQIDDPDALASALSYYMQSHPPDADFLATRMAIFYTNTPAQQTALVRSGQVAYVRQSQEVPPARAPFYELHDGYVFGGARLGPNSGSGHDCSDFSTLIMRKGMDSPSTGVMKAISRYLLASNAGERARLLQGLGRWKPFVSCFDAVDLRSGRDQLRPMDLVISNTELPSHGHVVVVENFDATTGEITDIEDKGGADGKIGEFKRPVYENSCEQASPASTVVRPPRPDLYALRFKEANNRTCPLNLEAR